METGSRGPRNKRREPVVRQVGRRARDGKGKTYMHTSRRRPQAVRAYPQFTGRDIDQIEDALGLGHALINCIALLVVLTAVCGLMYVLWAVAPGVREFFEALP